jgi:hypothetical protein
MLLVMLFGSTFSKGGKGGKGGNIILIKELKPMSLFNNNYKQWLQNT